MKKLLPLLILTLFLASGSSGAVVQDGTKHTLISSSGTRYEGVITEGTIEKGRGVFVVQSGEREGNRYEGEFLGEKAHGQGTFTTSDGYKYVGEFKDGSPHGLGSILESVLKAITQASSWWLIITIPGFIILKYLVPWVIGPAGFSPFIYLWGVINPIKYGAHRIRHLSRGKQRLSSLLYLLAALIYSTAYWFLIIVNLILLLRPLLS